MATGPALAGAIVAANYSGEAKAQATGKKSFTRGGKRTLSYSSIDGPMKILGIGGLCFILAPDAGGVYDQAFPMTVPAGTEYISCNINGWAVSNAGDVEGVTAFTWKDSSGAWQLYIQLMCLLTPESFADVCVEFTYLGKA